MRLMITAMLIAAVSAPALAEDATRAAAKEQWKENHPQQAERLENRKEKWRSAETPEQRDAMQAKWRENHPDAAAKMQERRENWSTDPSTTAAPVAPAPATAQ